jgi:DedD protein
MQNDQSDLELIFKKRARRRLVGAIALVLLMIIVLPMLLEDRTQTGSQQEIAIVMPNAASSEEKSNDSVSADVDGVTSEEEVIELPKPALTKPEVATVETEQKTEIIKPKEAPKAIVKPKVEAKQETTTKSVEKNKVVAKETVKQTDNQFYVQIGVFSDLGNVKKLQVKLNELGYQPVTEKITTEAGEKTRLRTANFVGKNEALIALENIKDAGLTGMVVSQK